MVNQNVHQHFSSPFSQFCFDTTLHGWYYLGMPSLSVIYKALWPVSMGFIAWMVPVVRSLSCIAFLLRKEDLVMNQAFMKDVACFSRTENTMTNLVPAFWFLVVICSVGILAWLTFIAFDGYMNNFILITIDDISASLDSVLFPSLVICNLNRVKASFMHDMNLTSDELDLLLNEFVYGKSVQKSRDEVEFIKSFLDSGLYNKAIDELLYTYELMDITPRDFIETNAEVFDIFTSFTYLQKLNSPAFDSHRYPWRDENTYKEMKKKWNPSMLQNFKKKYFQELIAPNVFDSVSYIKWSGKQMFINGDFGTELGICTWISPIVNDETEWSGGDRPLQSWITPGT